MGARVSQVRAVQSRHKYPTLLPDWERTYHHDEIAGNRTDTDKRLEGKPGKDHCSVATSTERKEVIT